MKSEPLTQAGYAVEVYLSWMRIGILLGESEKVDMRNQLAVVQRAAKALLMESLCPASNPTA